ncbi:MAG: hypothetical protein IKB70_02675 [Bacilli bacterium]|nr:hypothetical protein [Bacilli bacterium]
MQKKHNNSFDYIGSALSDNSILATEVSKVAYDSLRVEAQRVQNTPYYFSRGNLFEFIEGAKVKVAAAERGKIFNYEPVNAGRGLYQSPDDLSVFYDGGKWCFQAKVSNNPEWIVNAFSKEKYSGMARITTSDMYQPVKNLLEQKLRNGTITREEYDTLQNLKPGFYDSETGAMAGTSNAELYSLQGSDGKVDLVKLENYIRTQQNKAFINECVNNTKAVTLTSTVVGCVISSAQNFYKYFKDEQDIKTTAKNIGIDTAKAAGHGLLSSSIANGIKYIGYKSNTFFLRENVNALVIANGTIDLGRAFYHLKKGQISYNDFLHNIIASTALTTINLGVNFILAGHPLIKLVSTIVLNQLWHSLFKRKPTTDEEQDVLSHEKDIELMESIKNKLDEINNDLKQYIDDNKELIESIKDVFTGDLSKEINGESLYNLCVSLGLEKEFEIYESFDEKIDSGDKIEISFKRRK